MTVRARHSPCTLKVDCVVDQGVGQEAEFWGLFLFSFLNGKVWLCYKFHILERLVCPAILLISCALLHSFVYFKRCDFDLCSILMLQESIT